MEAPHLPHIIHIAYQTVSQKLGNYTAKRLYRMSKKTGTEIIHKTINTAVEGHAVNISVQSLPRDEND